MRIALFQDPSDPSFKIVRNESAEKLTEMLRVSEYVEVTFPERTDTAEAIAAQARVIDAEIARTEERMQKKLDALRDSKTKVLSLAFKPECAA